jgi:UDP-N-acetylmuramoyl-tripeptide--D-alanyl-D-alanine ligase
MESMTVGEILKACNGRLLYGDPRTKAAGISIDTRTIKEGELFLAIKGKRYDGHSFVSGAFRKKARGAIVSGLAGKTPKGKIIIRVRNTLSALRDIAGCYRGKFTLPVIAVTGSNGKSR